MIPFSPPRIDQKIIDEVVDTLRSGWITTGPKTRLFEKKIVEYTSAPEALCLNSATSGLELVLRWFGLREGDEVILPAYTYSATANVVVHCGAKPVFVDIDRDFNISVQLVRDAITGKTKVIMPVDFAGMPCDYDPLNELVRQKNIASLFSPRSKNQKKLGRILVLADAAHSFGAEYKGRRSGSLTDISVFSFHAVKNLTTAEGGAVCINLPEQFDNSAVYRELCTKALHGQTKDALAKLIPGNWRYDIIDAGYKYNMTDIQASLGLVEIERYENDTLKKRKYIFDRYSEELSRYEWAEIPVYEEKGRRSSFHVYPLRIKNITEKERDQIICEITRQQVSVNVHFIPVPMMSFYRKMGYHISNYPNAYDAYSCEISLPVFYDLTDREIDTVTSSVIASVENVMFNNVIREY